MHLEEYKHLRSFILPTPKAIFSFAFSKNLGVKHTAKLWLKHEADVQKVFKQLGIKDPGTIPCYLHGISCEGWFDVDDNSIHIRFPDNGGERELPDTIIHEILHLATYDKNNDYDQREKIVEDLLAKPLFQKLLEKI
jgi:hypothetical protein